MPPAWMRTGEAFEFAKALLLAREVGREAAQLIVLAAQVGVRLNIQISLAD